MNLSNLELSTILDRILNKAADNLRIAKILIQLGQHDFVGEALVRPVVDDKNADFFVTFLGAGIRRHRLV